MYINRPYKKTLMSRNNSSTKPSKKRSSSKVRSSARFRFKTGDLVRVSYQTQVFERRFNQRFSEEVFRVRQRILRDNIPVYLLADLQGQITRGFLFGPELVRISQPEEKLFKVDKILKRRGKGQNREALVRWLGYPSKFDQWLPVSSLKSI